MAGQGFRAGGGRVASMPRCALRGRLSFRARLRHGAALAALGLAVATAAEAQVAFPVSFDASAGVLSDTERAQLASHLQEAGRRWVAGLYVVGPRSIEIEVRVDPGAARANGGSATSAFVGVVGGRNTFEQGAAHELRTGEDPNGVLADIRIGINTAYLRDELWFDPDPVARTAAVPVSRTDALSVALHELGHALAYNGWADGRGIPPDTYWSTFDRWMLAGSPTLFDGSNVVGTWGSRPDLTTNNIHHWANGAGPTTAKRRQPTQWWHGVPIPPMACDGPVSRDVPPPGTAPRTPKGQLPATLVDALMNGVVFYRGTRYDISPLDLALLADAGLFEPPLFADGFEGD